MEMAARCGSPIARRGKPQLWHLPCRQTEKSLPTDGPGPWRHLGLTALARTGDAAALAVSVGFHATAFAALVTVTLLVPPIPPPSQKPLEVDLQPVARGRTRRSGIPHCRRAAAGRRRDEPWRRRRSEPASAHQIGRSADRHVPLPTSRIAVRHGRGRGIRPRSTQTNRSSPRRTSPKILIVKGAGSVGTAGAIGAVDRITKEILTSLEERPTLVVWLFDQSGSLKPQRESIAKRFDHIYEEFGDIESKGDRARAGCKTSRCSRSWPNSARSIQLADAEADRRPQGNQSLDGRTSPTTPAAAKTHSSRSTTWPTSFVTFEFSRLAAT